MSVDPFITKAARDWLFKGVHASTIGIEDLSIIGSGPFSSDDFAQFARRTRAEVLAPDFYTEVLVLGEGEWTEKELRRLLRVRSGKTLRVYSQQMFQMYLLSGNDPLSNVAIASRLGRGHPGLDFLRSIGFEWPSIEVQGFGSSADRSSTWRTEGFLKALDYSVSGERTSSSRSRHLALRRAYGARVPKRFGEDYREYWGAPKSALRLQRMAHSIARFYRMARGRTGDFLDACDRWERDLRWLKRQYYQGAIMFRWPSIDVR